MKKIFFLTFFIFSFVPFIVNAAEIRIDTHKASVKVGEEFIVDIIVNSEELINAIEGSFLFSTDMLEIRRVQNGGSSINFWIDEPNKEMDNHIVFSGITPGGFSGPNSLIFSVLFVAKQEGDVVLKMKNIRILKNDGNATELSSSVIDKIVHIGVGDSRLRKVVDKDTVIPEDFTAIVARDKNIFDGKYFITFVTQDKGTGIDHYEIREGKWGWFKKSESPYLLLYQKLNKDIYIKAIDRSGNERIIFVPASVNIPWWNNYKIFVMLIVVMSIVFFIKKR